MAILRTQLIANCADEIKVQEEVEIPYWIENGNRSYAERCQEKVSEVKLFKAALESQRLPYLDISRIHGGCDDGTDIFDLLGRWWHSGQPMTDSSY